MSTTEPASHEAGAPAARRAWVAPALRELALRHEAMADRKIGTAQSSDDDPDVPPITVAKPGLSIELSFPMAFKSDGK